MAQSIYVGGELFGLPFRVDEGNGGECSGKGKNMADGICLLLRCVEISVMN